MEALERAGANFFPAPDGDKYVSVTAKVGSVCVRVCVRVYVCLYVCLYVCVCVCGY